MTTASTTDAFAEIVNVAPTHCEFCGNLLKTTSVEVGGRVYDGLPCFGSCGCGRSRNAYEHAARPKETPAQEKYRRAGIPSRYDSAVVDCSEYTGFVSAGSSLYIHGVNGDGKSQLASCVAHALVDKGISLEFVNAKSIASLPIDKPDLFERMKSCGVLVIDDLGKEETGKTGWALSTVYELIDARYSNRKPIITTSNQSRGELADLMQQHGDLSTARAIASRLCEDCISVELGDTDMRLGGRS